MPTNCRLSATSWSGQEPNCQGNQGRLLNKFNLGNLSSIGRRAPPSWSHLALDSFFTTITVHHIKSKALLFSVFFCVSECPRERERERERECFDQIVQMRGNRMIGDAIPPIIGRLLWSERRMDVFKLQVLLKYCTVVLLWLTAVL